MPVPPALLAPLHQLTVALYLVAPIVAFLVARWRARRLKRPALLLSFFSIAVLGCLIGTGLCYVYATMGDGKMMFSQAALASYLAMALIFILRGVNAVADRVCTRLLTPRTEARSDKDDPAARPRVTLAALLLVPLATFVRVLLVTAIALPWIMAAVMVYRPRVHPALTPASLARWKYETVTFPAADGSRVSAYFIPAERPRGGGGVVAPDFATQTVLVVHGLGSNKGNALLMARKLPTEGYNVLSIDLRAHGDSAGQLTGLGLTEASDVLGAVTWLQANKPAESQHILGLGASQGAAALIAAAADPRGQAIDAVAVVGTFADLSSLMTSISYDRFPGPLGPLLRNLAFPLAEIHAGVPLRSFSPAAAAAKLWPRPLLVIHGVGDEIIPVNQGHQLFNAASLPKQALWLEGSHNSLLTSDPTAAAILEFFRTATKVPVI